MNEKVRNHRCFHSSKEFRQETNKFFEEFLPDIGGSLYTRINDNFQTFEPALCNFSISEGKKLNTAFRIDYSKRVKNKYELPPISDAEKTPLIEALML